MNSDKLAKQFQVFCILVVICVVINFVLLFINRGGGNDAALRKDLNEAYAKIDTLQREVAYLNEQAGSGSGGGEGGKGIAYELLEGRVSILEKSGVGSDASIDQRLKQLEMKVSTLEIAFKQANGISAANAGTGSKPNTTTTTNTTNTGNTKPQATTGTNTQATQPASGNRTPIQIQTGPSVTPSANAKYHTVQPGENLFRISQKYGLTVEQLRRLNGMKESDVLKAGQRLVVAQ